MSVKTIRFNEQEEMLINKILGYYGKDFSSCVKELFMEKMEDMQDIGVIQKIKEGSSKKDYLSADDISKLFK